MSVEHQAPSVLAPMTFEPCAPDDYAEHLTPIALTDLRHVAARFDGLRVLQLSAAPQDGGSSEAMRSFVSLLRGAGSAVDWQVPAGPDDRRLTLEAPRWWTRPTPAQWADWLSMNLRAAHSLGERWDVGLVCGPGLAGSPALARDHAAAWVWHAGLPIGPAPAGAYEFLRGFAARLHSATSPGDGLDPLSRANSAMGPDDADALIAEAGVDPERPYICHAIRHAPRPNGRLALSVLSLVRRAVPTVQLVLTAGRGPDAARVREAELSDPSIHLLDDLPARTVNALRRRATVLLDTSVGPGRRQDLIEALWAERPLVCTPHGTTRLVEPAKNGFVEVSAPALATRARGLLTSSHDATGIGKAGRATVQRDHLFPHKVVDWLRLLAAVLPTD